MTTFIVNLIFMILGTLVMVLFRALNHAGSRFQLVYFLTDNLIRFGVAGAIILIIQIILSFQPEFVEGLQSFGIVIPVAVSSVVGLGIGVALIKTIPTVKTMTE